MANSDTSGIERWRAEQAALKKAAEDATLLPANEREELLQLAGITKAKRAALIAQAVQVFVAGMKATKPRIGKDGKPIRGIVDHAERRHSAASIVELFGVVGSRMANAGNGKADVKISVGIAEFAQPKPQQAGEVIDVTPGKAEGEAA